MTHQIFSIFNNKGGVGKTTLTYHLAHSLAEMGNNVLLIDADPQCNLTIQCLNEDAIEKIWEEEEPFIDDFAFARNKIGESDYDRLITGTRSLHFYLKPTEDGTEDLSKLPRPIQLNARLHLVPGRLTLHMFEDIIASRWSDVFRGQPLALRTATKIRSIAKDLTQQFGYDYVIVDTSPSLGMLNRIIISTVDGFIVPCTPDLFSLYGIKNIGKSIAKWNHDFDTISKVVEESRLGGFPQKRSIFFGFTIYNARKNTRGKNEWEIAQAHYNYARKIPEYIDLFMPDGARGGIPKDQISSPIGGTAVMHSHTTLPSMAQKYHTPIWNVPSSTMLDDEDRGTIFGNRAVYEATKKKYIEFAKSCLLRMSMVI